MMPLPDVLPTIGHFCPVRPDDVSRQELRRPSSDSRPGTWPGPRNQRDRGREASQLTASGLAACLRSAALDHCRSNAAPQTAALDCCCCYSYGVGPLLLFGHRPDAQRWTVAAVARQPPALQSECKPGSARWRLVVTPTRETQMESTGAVEGFLHAIENA